MALFQTLSYGGEKTPVIFDIGNAFTKCGFAGENKPRAILPSEVKRQKTGKSVNIRDCTTEEELYATLVDFFYLLYFRYLQVNPKECRVVVVESLLVPTKMKNAIAKVLFKRYEVPSIMFAPSHLVTLFTLGTQSGLVMDTGFSDTTVVPVYEGTPLIKGLLSLPLAGQAIHNNLEAKLLESCTVKTGQRAEKQLSSITSSLEQDVLEDIKVRCCFVTTLKRAKESSEAAADSEKEAPAPPPTVEYPLDGGNILHIEGKIRENACEVLFEQDAEEQSVATLVLDSIMKCPIDMRQTLAENIVVVGGTAMTQGFLARLKSELYDLIERAQYKDKLSVKVFKFHRPPGMVNYIPWLGGAIFGALEVLSARSITREQYTQTGVIPDWCVLSDYEEVEDKMATAIKKAT